MQPYNGWSNKPTWLVNVWLDGTSGLAEAAREGHETLEEYVSELLDDSFARSAEEAREKAAISSRPLPESGLLRDLFDWAWSFIDWRELAEAWADDDNGYS